MAINLHKKNFLSNPECLKQIKIRDEILETLDSITYL